LTAVGSGTVRGTRRSASAAARRRRLHHGDDADVAGTHGRLRGRDGGIADGEHAAARAAGDVAVPRRLRQSPQDAVVPLQSHVRAQRLRRVSLRTFNASLYI